MKFFSIIFVFFQLVFYANCFGNPFNSFIEDTIQNSKKIANIPLDITKKIPNPRDITSKIPNKIPVVKDIDKSINMMGNLNSEFSNVFNTLIELKDNLKELEDIKGLNSIFVFFDNIKTLNFDDVFKTLNKLKKIFDILLDFKNLEKFQNILEKIFSKNFEEVYKRFNYVLDKILDKNSLDYGIKIFDTVNDTTYQVFDIVENNDITEYFDYFLDNFQYFKYVFFIWFFSSFIVIFLNIFILLYLCCCTKKNK